MSSTSKRGGAALLDVFAFLFRHWRRQPWAAVAVAGAIMLATLAEVVTPLYAGRLVDAVGEAHRNSLGDPLGAGREAAGRAALVALGMMTLLGAVFLALRQAALAILIRFTLRMMRRMKNEAFAHVQRLSTDWHANSFGGSVVRQVLRGAGAVDLLNDTLLFMLLPSLTVLFGSAVVLGIRWPVMGALIGCVAVVYLIVSGVLMVRWVAPAAALSNRWDTRVSGALADAVTCNPAVKAFGAELREEARLDAVLRRWQQRTLRTWTRDIAAFSVQGVGLLVLRTAVTGGSLWLWWEGQASAGDIATVLTTYFVVHGYLRNMGQQIGQVQRCVNDMQELVELMAQPFAVDDAQAARALSVTGGAVRFDRVGFRYGAHPTPLFEGLDVSIAAGERVGLVGASGSGKSTFVKLIQRLHDVTDGRITIDGQDVRTVTQASLRAQVAIVPQEPILFHRSLAENIAYGRPGATHGQIVQAAWLANAHGFIARLPKGYGTLVGERGVKLSGGERQRVAIARAFLADAPLLVMDEATSSLDSESEAAIQEAMERLMTGRTAIVIAHRLSTVRAMDRILVFERGRVIEEGTHDQLVLRPGGAYRRLFERQALGLVARAG